MSPAADLARKGWSGPHRLFDEVAAHALAAEAEAWLHRVSDPSAWHGTAPDFAARPWFKSLHAHSAAFHDLAHDPALVAAACSVLGPDVIAWGVSAMHKRPGDTHLWHIDVEHYDWRGMSAFVGLSGTVPGHSGLKFISGSQRLRGRLHEGGPITDAAALALAKRIDPACSLDYPPLGNGEYVLFDGPVWHASHNTGAVTRIAAIVQYAPASARVRVPLTFHRPIAWHSDPPPCLLVAGTDRWGINRLVGRPAENVTQL